MRRVAAALALAWLAAACDRTPQLAHEHQHGEDLSPHRTLERRLRMHDRFEQVEAIRSAIERADVAAARETAARFDLPVAIDMPPAARRHGDAIPDRARAITAAPDRATAAAAFASMLAECGACHAAVGARWEPLGGSPPAGPDLAARMARHAWASEALWESLLLDDEASFLRAASVLEETPLGGAPAPEDEHPPGLAALEARLVAAAIAARTARTREARAAVYGAVLATCGDCHDRIHELDRRSGRR